jgi:hypothetical protein
MRRPLPSVLLLAISVAGILWATSPDAGPGTGGQADRDGRPASFSAAVASSSTSASAGNWANRSAAASADPSRWGVPSGREAARRDRARMTRRLVALVVASSAERLGVPAADLRAAVGRVAREQRLAGRPSRAELTALRDRLAGALARELGVDRDRVLRVARAELGSRLAQGIDLGFVSEGGRRLALDCFDAPSACDVPALRRALRFGRLLGR